TTRTPAARTTTSFASRRPTSGHGLPGRDWQRSRPCDFPLAHPAALGYGFPHARPQTDPATLRLRPPASVRITSRGTGPCRLPGGFQSMRERYEGQSLSQPCREEVVKAIEQLLRRLVEILPCPGFHAGGDVIALCPPVA